MGVHVLVHAHTGRPLPAECWGYMQVAVRDLNSALGLSQQAVCAPSPHLSSLQKHFLNK